MNKLIIDVETHDCNNISRRLEKLKAVEVVEKRGEYRHCRGYSQIYVETTMTEDEVDHWLWKNNFDYVGVVEAN